MRATDEDRVLLTVSLLQEAAYDWWLTQPASQHEPPAITWAEFVRIFRNHFIPESYRDAKQKEFLMIKQQWESEGRETVVEYTTRFDRLLQYEDHNSRIQKFDESLSPKFEASYPSCFERSSLGK
ncbi:hypothetical protein LINPERPRIM_LOCUS25176 [Linum perenne]